MGGLWPVDASCCHCTGRAMLSLPPTRHQPDRNKASQARRTMASPAGRKTASHLSGAVSRPQGGREEADHHQGTRLQLMQVESDATGPMTHSESAASETIDWLSEVDLPRLVCTQPHRFTHWISHCQPAVGVDLAGLAVGPEIAGPTGARAGLKGEKDGGGGGWRGGEAAPAAVGHDHGSPVLDAVSEADAGFEAAALSAPLSFIDFNTVYPWMDADGVPPPPPPLS